MIRKTILEHDDWRMMEQDGALVIQSPDGNELILEDSDELTPLCDLINEILGEGR